MLAPIGDVLGVARQGSEHLPVSVGKPHARNDQVLAVLLRQAIGHTQTQGQRAVIGNTGDAELTACRFIPATQTKNSSLRASRQSLSHSAWLA